MLNSRCRLYSASIYSYQHFRQSDAFVYLSHLTQQACPFTTTGMFFLFVFFFFVFVFFFLEIAILHEPSATSDLGIHCLLRTLALCFIEPMEIQALQACGYYYYYFFFVRHLTKPVTGQGSPPERACHHIKRNFTIKL